MTTMTHTPSQRKNWHAGKAQQRETSMDAYIRCRKAGNYSGAATPRRFKSGIYYTKGNNQGATS